MDLQEFVKRTLLDITNGVSDAKDQSKLHIAPGFVEDVKITEPQFVNFDVQVTISQEGGGGIRLWSFGEVKADVSKENGHNISFKVPVFFQAPTEYNGRHFSDREEGNGENGVEQTRSGQQTVQQQAPDGEL